LWPQNAGNDLPAVPPEPRTDDDVFARLNDLVESDIWIAVGRGLLVAVGLLWLASIFAVYKDARRRVESPLLVGAAIWLATALPFVGAWLYRRLRPPQYLDEIWTRRLEVRALEASMERARATACPACAFPTTSGYLVCPACGERLRERCPGCASAVDPSWRACPWCEHDLTPSGRRPAALPAEDVTSVLLRGAIGGGPVPPAVRADDGPPAHLNGSAGGRSVHANGNAPGGPRAEDEPTLGGEATVPPNGHGDASRLRPAERG
jgi:hypothetical protein